MSDQVPLRLTAGTTVKFQRRFSEFSPTEGWTYKLFLVGQSLLNKDGVAQGNEWDITLTAGETGGLTPGAYRYTERVTKGSEVLEAGAGAIEVLPNLATAVAGDQRSHARKVLEAIEAVIAKTATAEQQSYQMEGRALMHWPLADLIRFRQVYQEEVRREQISEQLAQGLDDPRRIAVRFRRV